MQRQLHAAGKKHSVKKDWRLSDKYHKALMEIEFDPGDDLMVEMFLRQNKMEQLVKERYEQRSQVHAEIMAKTKERQQELLAHWDHGLDPEQRESFIQEADKLAVKNFEDEQDVQVYRKMKEVRSQSSLGKIRSMQTSFRNLHRDFSAPDFAKASLKQQS